MKIKRILPDAGIAGGVVELTCEGLRPDALSEVSVTFAGVESRLVAVTPGRVLARVPHRAPSGPVVLAQGHDSSNGPHFEAGIRVARDLHAVGNPAFDLEGNLWVTFCGEWGEKVEHSLFRLSPQGKLEAVPSEIVNPASLTFDSAGALHISSPHEGKVYRKELYGEIVPFADGFGTATGLAFDKSGYLYVGDREGTIYRVGPGGEVDPFVSLEPSVSAYHLAFDEAENLYITGPTLNAYDAIYRIEPDGTKGVFYSGLGRPEGMAFDMEGNLYVAATLKGRRGLIQLDREAEPYLVAVAPTLVGVAFDGLGNTYLVDRDSVYKLSLGIVGRHLP